MLSSLYNTAKYLRRVDVKSALQAARECQLKSSINAGAAARRADVALSPRVLTFSPRSIGVEIGELPGVGREWREPARPAPIESPRSILPLPIGDAGRSAELDLPPLRREEVQAARLIVIRKKKMKKHQRRKLWKRMRHRWARVRKHRRQVKEKIFQNELLALMKAAEEFSAESHVAGKLRRANHTPLPTRWRHKRLPEFIIRQLLGLDKKVNYKHTDLYKA